MKLRELKKDEIAIYRVDKENYIVLRKKSSKHIYENTKFVLESYIVQWWSNRMGYFWSNYELPYIRAIELFCEKITKNQVRDYDLDDQSETIQKEQPYNEDKGLDEHYENRTDLSGLSDIYNS